MKWDVNLKRRAQKCNGGANPPAANVARRVNKLVTESRANTHKGEGKLPRDKHTRGSTFPRANTT